MKLKSPPMFSPLKGTTGYRKAPTDDMLGHEVTGRARAYVWGSAATITGQVWAPASTSLQGGRTWFVVDSTGHAWLMHEDDMTIVAQRGEQLTLEDVS